MDQRKIVVKVLRFEAWALPSSKLKTLILKNVLFPTLTRSLNKKFPVYLNHIISLKFLSQFLQKLFFTAIGFGGLKRMSFKNWLNDTGGVVKTCFLNCFVFCLL